MNLESIRLALLGLSSNRLRSLLTMLGILIGVAAVIILVAVGSGSAAASRKRLEALGSNTLTVSTNGGLGARGGTQSRLIRIDDDDAAALRDPDRFPDVGAVVSVVNAANTTATLDGASATVAQTQGVSPEVFDVRSYKVAVGRVFGADDDDTRSRVVVVGQTVAKNLLGETADPAQIVGRDIKLGSAQFSVIGLLKAKGSNGAQDQDDVAFIPLTAARDTLTGTSTRLDQMVVQARSRAVTDSLQVEIGDLLVSNHAGSTSTSFRILNQASLLQTQDANNRTFTVLLGAVAAISLLVGGIGVMNIMLVTVTERTREIGIRKAIGATKGHILSQFLTETVVLSGLGGLLGVGAGLLGSRFTIIGVTPVVEPYSVALAFGVAVAVGLFFGLYPANRAASLRPIDALRYE